MLDLVQMSLNGSVLILVILLVRSLGKYRLAKSALLLLWCVAVLRLLLPWAIASPFSAYNGLRSLQTEWLEMSGPRDEQVHAIPVDKPEKPTAVVIAAGRIVVQDTNIATVPPRADSAAETQPRAAEPLPWLQIAWLAGFVLVGTGILLSHTRHRPDYRTSLPLEHEPAQQLLARLAGHSRIELRRSDRILSPLTYGLLRPVILLPARLNLADHDCLAYILAHEWIHIRRKDVLIKAVLALTLCLHWFNPLVWLLFGLAQRDLELSCDEIVVRRFGAQARAAYAMTLISLAETRGRLLGVQAFSQNALGERIRAIMKSRRQSFAQRSASLLLVGSIALAFATSAQAGELAPAEPLVASASDVFQGALGELGTAYADAIVSPAGERCEVTLDGSRWSISRMLATDLDVHLLLTADGPVTEAPVVTGRILGMEPDQTLYRLDGRLRELEPDASGTCRFLYSATLARADRADPTSDEQARLILAAGDQWRWYTSLADLEGASLALTLDADGKRAELAAPVSDVQRQRITLKLDALLHDAPFYDTAEISPFWIRLSGTAALSRQAMQDDFFWFEPDSELYLELADGQLIFAGRWGRDKSQSHDRETSGYRLGGGSASGDETSGDFSLEQQFRFFELDVTAVTALIVNGIRYPVSG
ncbi:MAG: M56 family metallopeptidase [Clostridiaceae bacterium]|nr:M56 family metallopeptidase [Clostridiaceae bacterium]